MSLSIYFTQPRDTPIAEANPGFIDGLKLAANSLAGVRPVESAAEADIVLIDERYEFRTWRYTDQLTSCDFLRQYASRILVINHDDLARVFFPGLYVSLEKTNPSLIHALPIPYKRDLWQTPVPEAFKFDPDKLFTFRGTYHSHPIRKKLGQTLSSISEGDCEQYSKAFQSHDEGDQEQYIRDILQARFSLCPRGFSPSTYRVYESMQLGRCPVIISDDWIPPPGPRWDAFAIFVKEADIGSLPEILSHKAEQSKMLGKLAHEAWQEHFSWPARWTYFLEQVVRAHQTKPDIPGFSELYDIWEGPQFRKSYKWTMPARAKQFIARKWRSLIE